MVRPTIHHRRWMAIVGLCAVFSCGCASGRLPMVDPTGQRFFVLGPLVRKPEPPPPGPHDPVRLQLTPAKVIAPVGAEVVLLAGVCRPDGYLQARERIEWMLASGGVGEFLAVGRQTPLDWFAGFPTWPRKVTNTYAIGSTSSHYLCLTRGTPTPIDDFPVERGQAWIAVTSPVEGTSYVTAYAPGVNGWDAHRQTSLIHWIDAEFAYPPPAINPAGTRHTFTTVVTRHTTHEPIAGWRVRYEITGGPPAAFSPDGAPLIEVATNELGQASAEIYQLSPQPGSNTVAIQVIRTGDAAGGERFVVGSGSTTKTWSSPDISLHKSGPAQAAVGQTLTYTIDVRNPGGSTAKEVVVTDQLADGLTLVGSDPPVTPDAKQLEWRLGDLSAGQARKITLSVRADRPGTLNNCTTVTTAEGITAQDCVATTIITSSLRVSVTGPEQAQVGDNVPFAVQVTNAGAAPVVGVVLVDRYDAGLEHSSQPGVGNRVIERELGDLLPGQTKAVDVTLRVLSAGELCNMVEVHAAGGAQASDKACVVASGPGGAAAAVSQLKVTKTGPPRKEAGQDADFTIAIANTGQTPVENVTVTDHFDVALEPHDATEGAEHDGPDLTWVLDRIEPGQTSRLKVICRCLEPADNTCNRVVVTSPDGGRAEAEACLQVMPPGARLSAAISEERDPVATGNQTTYLIQVRNNGADAERQVTVSVRLPDQVQAVAGGAQGPSMATIRGNTIQFAAVEQLAADATLEYRVQAQAVKAGNGVARATVNAAGLDQPVTAEETTTVVGR